MCHRMSYISYFIGCHIFSDTFIISAMDHPILSTKVVVLQKSLPCRKERSEKSVLGWHRCWHHVNRYLKMLKCSENKNKVWPARSYMNHSIHIFGCVSQQTIPISISDWYLPTHQPMSMGRPPKQNQTRNVEKTQLKPDVRTYNSHKFHHDGDANEYEWWWRWWW